MMATLTYQYASVGNYLPTDADAPIEQDDNITYAEWLEIVELLNQMD